MICNMCIFKILGEGIITICTVSGKQILDGKAYCKVDDNRIAKLKKQLELKTYVVVNEEVLDEFLDFIVQDDKCPTSCEGKGDNCSDCAATLKKSLGAEQVMPTGDITYEVV